MDIKDFVSKTMEQIKECEAVRDEHGLSHGDIILRSNVDFDLAVTVLTKTSSSNKTNLKSDIKVVGANTNSDNSVTASNEAVSRIKFSMCIVK